MTDCLIIMRQYNQWYWRVQIDLESYKRIAHPDWDFRVRVSQRKRPRIRNNWSQFEEGISHKNWEYYWGKTWSEKNKNSSTRIRLSNNREIFKLFSLNIKVMFHIWISVMQSQVKEIVSSSKAGICSNITSEILHFPHVIKERNHDSLEIFSLCENPSFLGVVLHWQLVCAPWNSEVCGGQLFDFSGHPSLRKQCQDRKIGISLGRQIRRCLTV